MKQVREGLYIGCLDDALAYLTGSKSEMTHILSVASINFLTDDKSLAAFSAFRMRESLRSSLLESVKNPSCNTVSPEHVAAAKVKLVRKTVPLMDTEAQNLLDYLEECLEFIENARKEGSVLVHCIAGISRSAAVITAYLMRSEKLTLKDALSALKQCSSTACPNKGFKRQLQMFEDMGFVVDKNSPAYKRFKLEDLGNMHERGDKIEISKFAEDPSKLVEPQASTTASSDKPKLFRCKKCRRLLALQENVLPHRPGERPEKWKNSDENCDTSSYSSTDQPCTSSLFVEPMQWMSTVKQGTEEGNLSCANCRAKVGSFNWAGFRCNCGTWITPAFQLHTSKVDASWT